MFSPGTKRSNLRSRRERNLGKTVHDSPITPFSENRKPVFDNSVPDRPSTGTPAPWAPRLSVLARTSPVNRADKGVEIDPLKPVYVGEFPPVVRDEQTRLLQKVVPGDACISGGIDKETSLAWIICSNKLFIWSYLLPVATMECVVLELPKSGLDIDDAGRNNSDCWLLSVVNWNSKNWKTRNVVKKHNSVGIILCNRKSPAVIYWPDIFLEERAAPLTCFVSFDEIEVTSSSTNEKSRPHRKQFLNGGRTFNSLIASAVPNSQHVCVAFACSSSGEIWQFSCRPSGIYYSKVCQDIQGSSRRGGDSGRYSESEGYPRSLIWRRSDFPVEEADRQCFLLTDHEIQCFNVKLLPDIRVVKLWSYEVVGTDSDLGIKKDLAGQKRIWPIDVQTDEHGKVITILVVTFCMDRVSSSSYLQYSLLTLQYKSERIIRSTSERVLEKKAPLQVIIPKARVEDEDFLFSMRLRVGGKPAGSAIILSGDGTATVSHYHRNSTRLYQFDLPFDAGKVLDASILPSMGDGEEGAWVVLTEKAGIWAIPEKAVVLGGVEPPERSLSRKGSSNEGSTVDDRKDLTFSGTNAIRKASSEPWDIGDRLKASVAGIVQRNAQDEESETLLRQLFNDFLLSGQVDASFEKLQKSGAFERDGETNIFTRMSKSIVDTLAKHWTTTKGAEIVAVTIISSQLIDKQEKHQKFLQFLALSKCHEELCSRRRHSLQIILEHGEKLAAMIQLRELQNMISQNRSAGLTYSHSSAEGMVSGALWDLIQLVGERARRSTVLLMDRDNAEVFYSKVSDLQEVFYCLDRQLEYVLSLEQPFGVQNQRACELSNACVSIINSAMHYKSKQQLWYPPPEGLTPWYGQPAVRNGMWHLASFMLQLLSEASNHDMHAKSELYSHLELLAEVLLEAYAGAVTAKVERGEDHKGLLDEFWRRRDTLLNSLYQQVKYIVEAGREGTLDLEEEILRKQSSHLLSIAKQHECYTVLWSICSDLNDPALLRNLMHESMGPNGGFSYFVFEQLYKKRHFAKLLRLGEEFHEELLIFLKQHPDLMWLHELFLHQFSSASETLHELALSQGERLLSVAEEEGVEPDHAHPKLSLADRKRLLYVSKIAAMADKHADSETNLMRIDADLKILKLQEEVVNLFKDVEEKQDIDQEVLRPEHIIELCLKGEDPRLSLKAFDAFAWTSSSFRKNHRKLLEECWKNAANQDNWNRLYQASVAQGWTDEETLQNLRETILFKASSKCYGPRAEIFGEGFDEVLPLRQENKETSMVKDSSGSSVEAILMQHKDFPEAGKLMLTAVMLGDLQDDTKVEDDSSMVE